MQPKPQTTEQTDTDLVSVIMPAFNASKTISVSITSVLSQEYSNLELLVIDDGSDDETLTIVQSFCELDMRIRLLKMERNIGVAQARNKGIEQAAGRYIAFLDSDDWWEPNKLQEQISLLKTSDADCCHAYFRRVSNSTDKEIAVTRSPKRVRLKDMQYSNQIGNLTGVYDTKRLGKFYQKDIRHEDYAMWLNILSNTDSVCVPKVLANYRVDTNSLSANKIRSIQWHFGVLRSELHMSVLRALYCTFAYVYLGAVKRL